MIAPGVARLVALAVLGVAVAAFGAAWFAAELVIAALGDRRSR